jgi:hypothetical protein
VSLAAVVVTELEVDDPADARSLDGETELLKRSLYGLALRIEDARLGTDENGRLHRSTDSGSST